MKSEPHLTLRATRHTGTTVTCGCGGPLFSLSEQESIHPRGSVQIPTETRTGECPRCGEGYMIPVTRRAPK